MLEYTILHNTDIYLIDQIMKNRYLAGEKLLDAGCGAGRNLLWFVESGLQVHGIDSDKYQIDYCREIFPSYADNFSTAMLDEIPYDNDYFDHIICSAVLHFAQNKEHFLQMFNELIRVLKPGGSLFIRMTSNAGLVTPEAQIADGVYLLKDETVRFLLTKDHLDNLMQQYNLDLLEPFKTTLVEDLRSMATIVLRKN